VNGNGLRGVNGRQLIELIRQPSLHRELATSRVIFRQLALTTNHSPLAWPLNITHTLHRQLAISQIIFRQLATSH
jgi:ribosomal protein S14